MGDCLDLVAVGVEDEGAVVMGVVFAPQSGRSRIRSAMLQGDPMEFGDRVTAAASKATWTPFPAEAGLPSTGVSRLKMTAEIP
ncbi:hypothetical protein [Bosea sp. Root381]|uniref:hypothetical protein n=1 Tax=Bosea sp. Root381 TaxID=1736524 RepID=UPI001FCCE97A|nr:hypothetical protein [Bosea sp. Root381]